ncbi:hypothetical protein KGQ19_10650 [Catenulispora sp. NL8]|uniref:Alanine and proline-rich secreted protein Apa n=1 Tax=Catenulispora pinistramenti TaxID=2705254 RepID=A0ABS5KMP4_9ACTN|nr:hypothetical protein [Catenulispora pinistramenti]MBS2547333.1 hypothetical protein [Catenulispora pinistramenti]
MTEDSQWMRDVFDTTRAEQEPIWLADAQAMIAGGDRRRRLRTVGAGSGSLAVVAVAATIAVSAAAPGGGGRTTTAPPTASPTRSGTSILDRVDFMPVEYKDLSRASGGVPKYIAVPEPAVSDMAALLSGLDPTSSHIVPTPNQGVPAKPVPFGDPGGDNIADLQVNSVWTPNGKPAAQSDLKLPDSPNGKPVTQGDLKFPDSPNGNLLTRFLAGDDPKFQPAMPGCGAAGDLGESWSTLDPDTSSPDAADQVAWSACDHRQLADGSVLASSTKSFGRLTAVFVSRQFPGGTGAVETLWLNYSIAQVPKGIAPNPDTVLSPSPLTLQKLTAVLSGSGIAPGLKAAATVTVPPTFLQAADFGAGWKVASTGAPSRPSNSVTDACATEQSDLIGPTVPDYTFSGPTPSGLNARADVLRLTVKSGDGAQKLSSLRSQAETGCAGATVTPLPSGIGDGGFVENLPGLPSQPWNVFVRFGDVLIQVTVNSPENSPAFTSADQEWLTGLAAKAATRFAAKG